MLQNATLLRKWAPWLLQNPHVLLTVDKIDNPLHLPRGTTAQLPKVVQTPSVFNILTSKCASRHNGVHFFDISTSKSGPNVVCFVHFDLEMCFAPQRRALFRHRNFQKWDGSAPAALASLLFDPPKPQIIGETQCFATFLPFRASASSFFWLFLFSDLLSSNLSLLSASALLCFSSVHIVGSLTSKLPSVKWKTVYCWWLDYVSVVCFLYFACLLALSKQVISCSNSTSIRNTSYKKIDFLCLFPSTAMYNLSNV